MTAPAIESAGADEGRRFGRRQGTAIGFGLAGLLLLAGVVPNITSDTRSFAFEPPPDPLQFSFSPTTLIAVVAVVYLIAGGLAFLPEQYDKWAGRAQVFAAALAIPLILALALGLSEAPVTNVTNLLDESLVLATPIALGSMTGLWCERSGIINIGIEGMMLASAGVGFTTFAVLGAASSTGWLWFSILVAILTGGLLAGLHAVLSIRFGINQIVSGVVVNLFALGFTGFLRSEVIVPSGNSKGISTTEFGIPLLREIPIVGETLFEGKPLHYLMYFVVFLTWLAMYRTAWGLRVRSCGENPHAAETLGIDVIRIRYQAVILGGFIAGLAGAWFSMESQSGFEDNMTNSAGFIALAAMIFGKWTPGGAFGGALLFGFARALGTRLQFLNVEIGGFEIPSEFFQMTPFLVTLVVVAGALGRAVAPAAEGQPYSPSK
ncbi:MAG: ABC transporter permease [Actinomycetia bacterium]|nr:ABC transporter permease [Actinomycetes bacterium]MCP4086903.1 ABC transporter permease [Actinomycetes bacterium]